MPLSKIKDQLEDMGCEDVTHDKSSISFSYEGNQKKMDVPSEWISKIKLYNRSNQYSFESAKRKLIGPKSIEIGIWRLNQNFFDLREYEFNSNKERKVSISRSSELYALHFFHSDEYKEFFEVLLVRKLRRQRALKFIDLFWFPTTIKFSVPRKTERSRLLDEGIPALEACLFKLAVEKGECWHFSKKSERGLFTLYEEHDDREINIPTAIYDENMIKYFKVAVSSRFPSQSFLSFYHVLEYNFLTVSNESLEGKLKSHINSTSFHGDSENLNKIVSIVKKHSSDSDETEMLSRVLRKYVDEEELIEFIKETDNKTSEKTYTKSREVFGKEFTVQAKKDHAIGNAAKLLKHVRNALVHSSDRYSREECHIPLTDSERIVEKYIPLVRFLAEKVIFARSS